MPGGDRVDGAPVIPGYRLVRLLGEGGMGRVYLAEDEALSRRAAVKVMTTRRVDSEDARARFLREARSLASVEHPNVVRVYAFGDAGGQPYLVMEYVEGESLADRLRREHRLGLGEALRIARAVAEALAAAWESGVVHRDIKPSNILLDRRGQVRVADFGLAKPTVAPSSDPTLTREGAIVGSPAYMSPEQGRGLPVDFRTDVYSLGVVLYEALAGTLPFQGATPVDVVAKHILAELPSLATKRPDLPPALVELVEWMTQKEPTRRPGSYAELLSRLASLPETGDQESGSTLAMPAVARRRGGRRDTRFGLVAAGTLLLLLAAGAAVRWLRPAPRPIERAGGLAIAIAPFYGPDEESTREGKVMASLVQGEVLRRLGGLGAAIVGPDEVREVVRDHAAARALGERTGASVVIWGEALVVHGEAQVQPYFTLVPPKKAGAAEVRAGVGPRALDPLEGLGERAAGPVVLEAQATNQIGLRRTGAAGVGDLVLLLAGVQALYAEDRPEKALSYFNQAPRSSESLRYRAEALERLGRFDEALATARQAASADPGDPSALALLGDCALRAGLFEEAVASHRRAAATGKPYTARRAIFHADRLYVRETFRSLRYRNGNEEDTGYLLALDPSSGRVLERHQCPGAIRALRSAGQGEGFEVTFLLTGVSGGETGRIGFSRGRFDRPVFCVSLLVRRLGVTAGWTIASNFVNWTGGVSFGPVDPPVDDAPRTLPELERALRAARDRDPTQPWHALFLGLAEWAQGRREEAAAEWDRMLGAPYSATPYYEYAYMAVLFEKTGQPDWADRAFAESLARRRRMAQPVAFTTALERMIDTPFVAQRFMAPLPDERAFVWVQRARALTGVCGEGDAATAALWSRHWRRRGDAAAAAAAEELRQRAGGFPFTDRLVHVDLAWYAFTVAVLSFWTTLAVLVVPRGWRSRPIARLPPSAGRLMLVAGVACLASSLWLAEAGRRLARAAELDIGHADATGSAFITARLDALVARCDVPQTRWVAAVAHHLAGNRDRAAELYRSLPGDTRAAQNLDALERGSLTPPVALTGGDLLAAHDAETWTSRLAWLAAPGRALGVYQWPDVVSPISWLTLLTGLVLAVAVVRPRASAPPSPAPSGRLARWVRRLVPGVADLWAGRVWRGYGTLVLFLFATLVVVMQVASLAAQSGLGPLTSFQGFTVLGSYLVPASDSASGRPSIATRWEVLLSHEHATVFVALAAAAALAAIVLHARRLRE